VIGYFEGHGPQQSNPLAGLDLVSAQRVPATGQMDRRYSVLDNAHP
jgi:hypothetical protein